MDELGGLIYGKLESSKWPLSVDDLSRYLKKSKSEIEKCLQTLKEFGMIKSNHHGLWSLPGEMDPEEDLSLDAERFDDSLSVLYDRSRQSSGVYPETTTEPPTEPKVLNGRASSSSSSSPCYTVPKVPIDSPPSSQSRSSPSQSRELSSSATDVKMPCSESSDARYSLAAYRQREDRTPNQHVTMSGTEEEDLSRRLQETSLKEPVQRSISDDEVLCYDVRRAVIPRQNSDHTNTVVVGTGGFQMETTERVNSLQLSRSDPHVQIHKNILGRVIQLFREQSHEQKPLDVAKKCIDGKASKKDINRYLHSLNKAEILSVTYQNKEKNSDPRWKAGPKLRDVTDAKVLEMAAEFSVSGASKSGSRSDLMLRQPESRQQHTPNSAPYVVTEEHHHHYHKHEHNTIVQVGENNQAHVNLPDIENERERITEREVEKDSSP